MCIYDSQDQPKYSSTLEWIKCEIFHQNGIVHSKEKEQILFKRKIGSTLDTLLPRWFLIVILFDCLVMCQNISCVLIHSSTMICWDIGAV